MRVALSHVALVVHNFMTTDDHEWRYGHGDTLHGVCISAHVLMYTFIRGVLALHGFHTALGIADRRHKS